MLIRQAAAHLHLQHWAEFLNVFKRESKKNGKNTIGLNLTHGYVTLRIYHAFSSGEN
jgi:hypothetical protein